MITAIEPVLYIDPQAQIPKFFCPRCGEACFGPGTPCLRCRRTQP